MTKLLCVVLCPVLVGYSRHGVAQGPVLLRLAYHDAATYSAKDGTGGANASIQYELSRPENTGLKRGWGVIEQVCCIGKAQIET